MCWREKDSENLSKRWQITEERSSKDIEKQEDF